MTTPTSLAYWRGIVRGMEIDCKEVNDGQKGLFEIQNRHYDLIFLDIEMPFYTGFDILRQLKKQGVRHKCIIILTGSNLKIDDIADYIDVGVREILKKPIGLDQFDKDCEKLSDE